LSGNELDGDCPPLPPEGDCPPLPLDGDWLPPVDGVSPLDGWFPPRRLPPLAGCCVEGRVVLGRLGVVVLGGTAVLPSSRVAANTPIERAAAAPTALATSHRRRLERGAGAAAATVIGAPGGGGGSGVP
jgi:hypothetical protein